MKIRRAAEFEANALSAITVEAKAHWPYSAAQLDAWRNDLTVTAASISALPTYVAELEGKIVGFYSLGTTDCTWKLEHLWVRPTFMGRGVGQSLLSHATNLAAQSGVASIAIDADPNAEPFYIASGAQRVGAVAAPIDGLPTRQRPQLLLATAQPNRAFESGRAQGRRARAQRER
jgi:ribosomal protein S18 acetylase RimI-like enzyme